VRWPSWPVVLLDRDALMLHRCADGSTYQAACGAQPLRYRSLAIDEWTWTTTAWPHSQATAELMPEATSRCETCFPNTEPGT
jgi:hypothetical protein